MLKLIQILLYKIYIFDVTMNIKKKKLVILICKFYIIKFVVSYRVACSHCGDFLSFSLASL